METKTLLAGLIGFFLGGLLVSVAATTFDKPETTASGHTSMMAMTQSLRGKTGDEYDKSFIAHMIEHHEGAVDMAKLSAKQAKHEEIKQLSRDIIQAQEKEIGQMRSWQKAWGYGDGEPHGSDAMPRMHQ